eukprot:10396779-Alexandrium_andersonii.AAC.1
MGIAQGCPLSMLWLAMLTHPVVGFVREHGGVPRTLADDATVSPRREGHWQTIRGSGSAAIDYLQRTGSRVRRPGPLRCPKAHEPRRSCRNTDGRLSMPAQ